MEEIEIALQYAKKKKTDRLKQNRIYRQKSRIQTYSSLSSADLYDAEAFSMENIVSVNPAPSDEEISIPTETPRMPMIPVSLMTAISKDGDSTSSNNNFLDFDDLVHDEEIPRLPLHQHTSMDCFSFAKDLIEFIRKANICKTHAERLVSLIHAGLPQPNAFPKTYINILDLLSGKSVYLLLSFTHVHMEC